MKTQRAPGGGGVSFDLSTSANCGRSLLLSTLESRVKIEILGVYWHG